MLQEYNVHRRHWVVSSARSTFKIQSSKTELAKPEAFCVRTAPRLNGYIYSKCCGVMGWFLKKK
jgi:hypothetical protein